MGDLKSDAKVLEDGTEALVEAETGKQDEGVEFSNLDELGKTVELAVKPDAAAAAATAAAEKAKPTEDDELPTEFKGKSRKDIVKMYQDAHKVIGRQGSELGELRNKADFAIKASLEALRGRKVEDQPGKKTEVVAAPDESEFFNKPFEAVSKAIADHPVIKEIRETLGRAAADQATSRATTATERFNRAHPDAPDILRDEEFRDWVSASPIRRDLLQRAHQRYDFDAGDEVFSTWKALKGVKSAASKVGEQSGAPDAAAVSAAAATLAKARAAKADAAAKAAAVPTGGASGATKPMAGKKVFRRADVIRLMQDDPDRYEMLADELALAYAEGRVR